MTTPTLPQRLRQMADHTGLDAVAELLREAADTIERREAVIRILERDAAQAHQRASNAIGTRKVLWNLLGECLPLLEYDAQETHCGESHDQIANLIRRINDARAVVQAEELPANSDAHGPDWTDRDSEYLK